MRTSKDFFLAGRSMPAWVCGLAFISAISAPRRSSAWPPPGKYGIVTSHFYWIGAIPAMLFVGLFMMPFYYGSKARSVPEYLRLRFDEKTRAVNAFSFAIMTVFSSGISMYAMAMLIQMLGLLLRHRPEPWTFHVSHRALRADRSRLHLPRRTDQRHLQRSAAVLPYRRRLSAAGLAWSARTSVVGKASRDPSCQPMTHSWRGMAHANTNPLGVEWFGLVMGLGFVLSFGYWCTDFLVVQRAMAAESMSSARRVPLIAAIPKMFFPFLVILPGLIAIA